MKFSRTGVWEIYQYKLGQYVQVSCSELWFTLTFLFNAFLFFGLSYSSSLLRKLSMLLPQLYGYSQCLHTFSCSLYFLTSTLLYMNTPYSYSSSLLRKLSMLLPVIRLLSVRLYFHQIFILSYFFTSIHRYSLEYTSSLLCKLSMLLPVFYVNCQCYFQLYGYCQCVYTSSCSLYFLTSSLLYINTPYSYTSRLLRKL